MSTLLTQCPECGGTLCLSRNAVTCGGCGWSRPAAVYLRWLCQSLLKEVYEWRKAAELHKVSLDGDTELEAPYVFQCGDRVASLRSYRSDFLMIYHAGQYPENARTVLNQVKAIAADLWHFLRLACGGQDVTREGVHRLLEDVILPTLRKRPEPDWNGIAAAIDSEIRAMGKVDENTSHSGDTEQVCEEVCAAVCAQTLKQPHNPFPFGTDGLPCDLVRLVPDICDGMLNGLSQIDSARKITGEKGSRPPKALTLLARVRDLRKEGRIKLPND